MTKARYGEQNGKDKPPRKQGGLGENDDAVFRGYINVNLTDEQKQAYDVWAGSASLWEALEFHVSDGVNISLKYLRKEGTFLASATQRRSASANAGLVVTARGRDAGTAWGRVLYILTILAHKERWEDTQPLANPDRW